MSITRLINKLKPNKTIEKPSTIEELKREQNEMKQEIQLLK